jgi:ribosomal-protein-alanine N-acetyltransferase
MMLKIRRAEEGDMPDIRAIEQVFSPPWSESALLFAMYNEHGEFFVADESGWVVGFAMVKIDIDEAELLQLAVDSASRRRGVATELLTWTLGKLLRHGICGVFLEVRTSNTGAIALYEKFGFERLGMRKNYYDAPVEDAIVMRFELGK